MAESSWMDQRAELINNEDIKEFYLGLSQLGSKELSSKAYKEERLARVI
jgi:hypothetical protein